MKGDLVCVDNNDTMTLTHVGGDEVVVDDVSDTDNTQSVPTLSIGEEVSPPRTCMSPIPVNPFASPSAGVALPAPRRGGCLPTARSLLRPGVLAMLLSAVMNSCNSALTRLLGKAGVDEPLDAVNGRLAVNGSAVDVSVCSFLDSLASGGDWALPSAADARKYSSFQILYIRAIIAVLGTSLILFLIGQFPFAIPLSNSTWPDKGMRNHIAWCCARGVIGFCALSCLYYSLSSAASLTEAASLYSASPIFTFIFSLFSGDAKNASRKQLLIRTTSVLFFIAGVIVSMNPSAAFTGSEGEGVWPPRVVAIIGSAFAGASVASAKRMASGIRDSVHQHNPPLHWASQAWWQATVACMLAPFASFFVKFKRMVSSSNVLPAAQFLHGPSIGLWNSSAAFIACRSLPQGGLISVAGDVSSVFLFKDFLLFVSMGLCGLAGQCLFGFAVSTGENAAVLGVLWNFDIIFSLFWQGVVFTPTATNGPLFPFEWFQVVGVILVFFGSTISVFEKVI